MSNPVEDLRMVPPADSREGLSVIREAFGALRRWFEWWNFNGVSFRGPLEPGFKVQIVFHSDGDAYLAEKIYRQQLARDPVAGIIAFEKRIEIEGIPVEFLGPTIRIER
jgi:hypothetical protein